MKDLNAMTQVMNHDELVEINGGDGNWHWYEALYCFAIGGASGVIAYTEGTMQN